MRGLGVREIYPLGIVLAQLVARLADPLDPNVGDTSSSVIVDRFHPFELEILGAKLIVGH